MRKKLYLVWYNMMDRCYNENNKNYKDYGARGIKIYFSWMVSFNNFYKWAITHDYKEGLQIDRINNDDSYTPFNCRWITHKENQQNKRLRKDSRNTEINGEFLSIKDISKKYNIPLGTLNTRYRNGLRGLELIKPKNK